MYLQHPSMRCIVIGLMPSSRPRPLQVQVLLHAKRWETRTAAGECIGLIAEHVQHPAAADLQRVAADCAASPGAHAGGEDADEAAPAGEGMLSLDAIDMQRVMEQGTPLLASGGQVLPFSSCPLTNCPCWTIVSSSLSGGDAC